MDKQLRTKSNFFNLGGSGIKTNENEAIQSLFNLTLCLDDDLRKMTDPVF